MNHVEKLGRWREFAKSKGWKSIYPAPHEWLVIKLTGKECTPSFFWPSWILGILAGSFWGIFWATFMYLSVWRDKTFLQIAVPSFIGGLLFGLVTAVFHSYQKRKHGLTTWDKFIEGVEELSKRI